MFSERVFLFLLFFELGLKSGSGSPLINYYSLIFWSMFQWVRSHRSRKKTKYEMHCLTQHSLSDFKVCLERERQQTANSVVCLQLFKYNSAFFV